jgi:hypothetical protein
MHRTLLPFAKRWCRWQNDREFCASSERHHLRLGPSPGTGGFFPMTERLRVKGYERDPDMADAWGCSDLSIHEHDEDVPPGTAHVMIYRHGGVIGAYLAPEQIDQVIAVLQEIRAKAT